MRQQNCGQVVAVIDLGSDGGRLGFPPVSASFRRFWTSREILCFPPLGRFPPFPPFPPVVFDAPSAYPPGEGAANFRYFR